MAAGDTLQGKRLPLGEDGLLADPEHQLRPGEYTGPVRGYTADKPAVFYALPNGHIGHVTSPPHTFHEEDDGSLTIRASILQVGGAAWHGYLERGVWREV